MNINEQTRNKEKVEKREGKGTVEKGGDRKEKEKMVKREEKGDENKID